MVVQVYKRLCKRCRGVVAPHTGPPRFMMVQPHRGGRQWQQTRTVGQALLLLLIRGGLLMHAGEERGVYRKQRWIQARWSHRRKDPFGIKPANSKCILQIKE